MVVSSEGTTAGSVATRTNGLFLRQIDLTWHLANDQAAVSYKFFHEGNECLVILRRKAA